MPFLQNYGIAMEIDIKIPGNLKKNEKKQRKILPEGLIPEKVRYIITEFDSGSTTQKKGWKHEKNAFVSPLKVAKNRIKKYF